MVALAVGCAGEVPGGTEAERGDTGWADGDGGTRERSSDEPPATTACVSDASCDDGDACTRDACTSNEDGEFAAMVCTHTPIDGCGGAPADEGFRDPVDPACGTGIAPDDSGVLLPFEPLGPIELACTTGFEFQNCVGTATATATSPSGSPATTLVVDFATYTAADRLRIEGVDASGATYVLLDTCRVRTWTRADPTRGEMRPPDETIRRFEVDVRAGTRSLTFDSTYTTTPWYMRVIGLCDFTLHRPEVTRCDTRYRLVSAE